MIGWSPDGSRLAYVAEHQGTSHIWAQRIQDGKLVSPPEILVRDSGRRNFLGVAANGDVLYLVTEPNTRLFTATLDPSTGTVSNREQLQPRNEYIVDPVWSPDGRMLSYMEIRKNLGSKPKARLMVRDLSTGADRMVAEPGSALPGTNQSRFILRGLSWDRTVDRSCLRQVIPTTCIRCFELILLRAR